MSTAHINAAVALATVTLATSAGLGGAPGVGAWEWNLLNDGATWIRRAGLQVLDRDGSFYLMGGRTSRPPLDPPVPGDSDIWGDVWKSDDHGTTWEMILDTASPGHWPARAYFRAALKDDQMFVFGGQNFLLIPNPDCPPPHDGCSPFISVSDFFSDVWSSTNGVDWTLLTADAGWSPRAGLSSVVFNDAIYVIGGSFLDDPVFGGPPVRIYYNDVWRSVDGITWEQVAADPPFAPRAGGVTVVKDGFMYLIGGEEGFLCEPFPFCDPPYFNDVWRSSDGANWELVTASAAWSPRPGHQVVVADDQFILFGGFGLSDDPANPFAPGNPMDVWVSSDGAEWTQVSDAPWNATMPGDIKYDFAALVSEAGPSPAIYTFGGDRESFDFTDPRNYLNIDNDVWRFAPPSDCPADFDEDGTVGTPDLVMLLSGWGRCDSCLQDLDNDDAVDFSDLLLLLSAWGPCP